jgi:hypothetical protein
MRVSRARHIALGPGDAWASDTGADGLAAVQYVGRLTSSHFELLVVEAVADLELGKTAAPAPRGWRCPSWREADAGGSRLGSLAGGAAVARGHGDGLG